MPSKGPRKRAGHLLSIDPGYELAAAALTEIADLLRKDFPLTGVGQSGKLKGMGNNDSQNFMAPTKVFSMVLTAFSSMLF